ncbi:MAG: ParB/RepB/Spo0J family partition protein [Legionellaceae bacterium]|nr:ParB/RepB/Spo0J family partition protein [Legionellaceae bacterium]
MSGRKSGLGRNLSALLGQSAVPLAESSPKQDWMRLHPEQLQAGKYQPRTDFDEQALQELADSIKQQGLLQPLVVRELRPEQYEIIAGERRFRACQLVGLREIPVVLRQVDDETAMAMALVENLQREDLNAVEQARAMARLIDDFDLTHQQVAELLGKSRASVSNFLRLLSLSTKVLNLLERGELDMGHARALLSLPHSKQEALAQDIIAHHCSVRETEQRVKKWQNPPPPPPPARSNAAVAALFTETLQQQSRLLASQLETKVQLKGQKNGKGALLIHFENPEKLELILRKLASG